jgi:hypothetical protein
MKVRGSIGIRSLLGNVVFGTVVTAIPVVVLAAQIPTTSARYDINLSGTFDPVNDTNIVNTNSAPSTTTSNSDGTSSCIVNACSGATGSSTASADFGTLRAGSTGAVAGAVTGPTGASVGGSYSVDAQVQYIDDITVLSDNLANGTVVQATVYLALNGSVGVDAFGGNSHPTDGVANLDAILSFAGGSLHLCTLDDPFGVTPTTTGCVEGAGASFLETSMIADFVIGQQYAIEGTLTSNVFGWTADQFIEQTGTGETSSSSAFANATHTSNTYLQPLGDFFFSSGSGHDYSLPDTNGIPEPGTLALLSVGVMGASLSRRRRGIAGVALG